MGNIRHIIERHFGLVLLAACLVGLAFPAIGEMPDASAAWALAMLTYASCFKLKDGGLATIRWRQIMLFYILRYIVLPVGLFWLAQMVIPSYALGILLLAVLPAAVSSPAFAHMFGGYVPPAFAVVMVSTVLAPFMIPLHYLWASEIAVEISPLGLFRTLAFCVLVPIVGYLATRRLKRWGDFMYRQVTMISITLVAFVIALVIAKQRELILADMSILVVPLAASIACFAAFIGFGAWFGRREPLSTRITYTVCSGFNNVALGVSLALVHFPPAIILLVAVSEMAWSLVPTMMGLALKIIKKS